MTSGEMSLRSDTITVGAPQYEALRPQLGPREVCPRSGAFLLVDGQLQSASSGELCPLLQCVASPSRRWVPECGSRPRQDGLPPAAEWDDEGMVDIPARGAVAD